MYLVIGICDILIKLIIQLFLMWAIAKLFHSMFVKIWETLKLYLYYKYLNSMIKLLYLLVTS